MDARISAAFRELGIVVPPAYNGACLRCGRRGTQYDDLCGDCEDLCEGGADGFDRTIRSELSRVGWYISCLGDNAPPPDCTSCGRKPSRDPAFICVDSELLLGNETIVTFFLCESCDAYTLVVNRFWPAEGGARPVVAGGVIPRFMGDSDVEMIRSCPSPQDADCECDAHAHFVEMAEFMADKEAERAASPDRTPRRGNADGSPLTPEQLLADPDFIKDIARGLAARSESEAAEPGWYCAACGEGNPVGVVECEACGASLLPGGSEETSGLAIASLSLGIASFFTCGLAAIPGLILGIVALGRIRRSQGAIGGKGLAIGGICTSAAGMLFMLPAIAATADLLKTYYGNAG